MNKNFWVWMIGLLLLGVSSVTAYSTYCIVLSNNTICFNDSGIYGVSNITATNINASEVLNPYWLNITDQRYNDTALILSVNSSLASEILNRIGNDSLKLNVTDQRYNDSAAIALVQASLSGNATSLANEILNRISNDTAINNSLASEISARQSIGNWSADKSSYNTTVQLLTLFYLQSNPYNFINTTTLNETDPIFVANRTSIWSGINARAFPGNCPSGFLVMNTTTSGVECVNSSLIGSLYYAGHGLILNSSNGFSVNETSLVFDVLSFNTTSGVPSTLSNGTCYFTDGDNPTYNCVIDAGAEVVLQLGEELYLDKPAKNGDSVVIPNCAPVYMSGAVGSNSLVKLVNDTNYRRAQAFIGLATQEIPVNGFGRITIRGAVGSCNTSAWSIGTALYLSETNGVLTNVTPTGNKTKVFVGIVTTSNANNGVISVQPMFIPSPDDLSKVNWVSTNNGVLVYDSSIDTWRVENIQLYNLSSNVSSLEVNLLGNASALTNEVNNRVSNDSYLNTSIVGNATALTNEVNNRVGNDSLKVNKSGDTMTGNLILGTNSLNFTNVSIKQLTSNSNIDGGVIGIMMTNPPGVESPHMILQSGGGTQASVLVRSVMIQNENTTFQNSVDATDCGAYMSMIGDTLKIDCNTTTTGADLLVSDDLQVAGDVWLKDSQGEYHYMTKELTALDYLQENTIAGDIETFSNTSTFVVYNANSSTTLINMDSTNYIVSGNLSVALNSGTNSTPTANYITIQGTGTLTNDASYPGATSHIDIARIIRGEGHDYLYLVIPTKTQDFVYNSYDVSINSYEKYISGFTPSLNATDLNLSSGEYWNGLMEFESNNNLRLNTDGFFIVLNNGSFVQCTDLSCLTQYNDGGTIAANAYFNVVWAILPSSSNTSRLVAIPQNTPSATYTSAAIAEQDASNTITFSVNNAELTKHKLVLIKTIVRNSNDQFQTFTTGGFYKNIVGLPVSGTAAGGTNDHSLLTNLDYASSGHTGFVNTTMLDSEAADRVSNDSLKADLVGDNSFVGDNEFTGTTYINTTLNIKDGAGANGTTIQGNTIWTGTLYVVNISQATIVPAINVNGSYMPLLSDTFYLGNNTRVWKGVTATDFYGNINASYVTNSPWYLASNPNSYYNVTTAPTYNNISLSDVVSGVGNWSADKASYNTTAQLNTLYYGISNPNSYYNVTTAPTYNNISLADVVSGVGNWSADKTSYNTTAQNNLLYYGISNPNSYYNSTTIPAYALDSRVDTVNTTATNALPKAGGTMTGNISMDTNCITFSTGGSICG
jgi:hypothetical protein